MTLLIIIKEVKSLNREELLKSCVAHDQIASELYQKYAVKRGLRDENGKGVVAGLTTISTVYPEKVVDGKVVSLAVTEISAVPA